MPYMLSLRAFERVPGTNETRRIRYDAAIRREWAEYQRLAKVDGYNNRLGAERAVQYVPATLRPHIQVLEYTPLSMQEMGFKTQRGRRDHR